MDKMAMLAIMDIETTGTRGIKAGDHIVDIGVTILNTKTNQIIPFYSAIIGYNTDEWDEAHRNAWIFNNTDLKIDTVKSSKITPEEAALQLRLLTCSYYLTSFNMDFDFKKFLDEEPWNLKDFQKAPDIMLAADKLEEIPRSKYDSWTGWRSYPSVQATYNYLFGEEDPAGIHNKQDHRALSDTIVEAHILRELIKRGLYKIPGSKGGE